MDRLLELWHASGLYQISGGQVVMLGISLLLLYLGIAKKFEPLLLVTIGFGGLMSNIPGVEIATGDGLLHLTYVVGIETGAFPLIIFMGVGALTDFGPLLANPRTLFLGAAAQFGIFATLLGALGMTSLGWTDFTVKDAAAIGIIGGADGPTAIYVAGQLAPDLLGAIAVAAYSYMALVPMIQPPIMKLLTTEAERKIKMVQLREVSKTEKILFPILLLLLVAGATLLARWDGRRECADWFAARPLLALALLGGIWWLVMKPAAVGLLIILLAAGLKGADLLRTVWRPVAAE